MKHSIDAVQACLYNYMSIDYSVLSIAGWEVVVVVVVIPVVVVVVIAVVVVVVLPKMVEDSPHSG